MKIQERSIIYTNLYRPLTESLGVLSPLFAAGAAVGASSSGLSKAVTQVLSPFWTALISLALAIVTSITGYLKNEKYATIATVHYWSASNMKDLYRK